MQIRKKTVNLFVTRHKRNEQVYLNQYRFNINQIKHHNLNRTRFTAKMRNSKIQA